MFLIKNHDSVYLEKLLEELWDNVNKGLEIYCQQSTLPIPCLRNLRSGVHFSLYATMTKKFISKEVSEKNIYVCPAIFLHDLPKMIH